jgi:predicted GIY-YIG superfamily endonuclease
MFAETIVQYERESAGVYELGNSSGQVIYIGSTNNVRRRLREHLAESGTCIKRNASVYRVEYTSNYLAREGELYDEYVRLYGRAPHCNEVRPGGR